MAKTIEKVEKGKGVGQWLGSGVLDVAWLNAPIRFGEEIPKGALSTEKLNAYKERGLIGKLVEPVSVTSLDVAMAELEKENAELKKRISELEKAAAELANSKPGKAEK